MSPKKPNQVNIDAGISENDALREAWRVSRYKSDPLIEYWQETIRKREE